MARAQSCHQQTEVREDRGEEADYSDSRALRKLSSWVSADDTHSLFLPLRVGLTEEFAIYLNYVRKLGFEEQPDYDFMRDLFTKALEGTGEVEDGVYDWMLLNGGKGWQANSVSTAEYAICTLPPLSTSR